VRIVANDLIIGSSLYVHAEPDQDALACKYAILVFHAQCDGAPS